MDAPLQGFFGSLREEFIIKKKDISITICNIGFVRTENVVKAWEEFHPGLIYKFPIDDASTSALRILKGGAQRWNGVRYPKIDSFIFLDLYSIFPETIAALVRYYWD